MTWLSEVLAGLINQLMKSRNKIWATSWQKKQNDCVPGLDSDQPGHPPSLIRVFAVRSMGSKGPKLSSCGQRRLIRLGGCPGWSQSSLGTHAILMDLSWDGSFCFVFWIMYLVNEFKEMNTLHANVRFSDVPRMLTKLQNLFYKTAKCLLYQDIIPLLKHGLWQVKNMADSLRQGLESFYTKCILPSLLIFAIWWQNVISQQKIFTFPFLISH